MTPQNSPVRRRNAFTLIELLAVITVIAVVVAFAIPATNSILRGNQLTQGSQMVGDQLALARQLALSRNRAVEVRFYQFGDPGTPGENIEMPAAGQWRGMQLFEVMENGAIVPVGPFQRLPRMTVLVTGELSTLLDENKVGAFKLADSDRTTPELPVEIENRKVGRNYRYTGFRFNPDGSTNLPIRARDSGSTDPNAPSDTWYVTVVNLNDRNRPLSEINYATIMVDPVSGSQKVFRPRAG